MFGRLVDVTVFNALGDGIKLVDSSHGNNALVCSGKIERTINIKSQPKLTLSIYNLSSRMRGEIVVNKYEYIKVEFGYEDLGNKGSEIFLGKIQRLQYKRKDEVTSETIIYAWENGDLYSNGFYSNSFMDGVNYYEIATSIAKEGEVPISINLSEKLKNYKTAKPISLYGSQIDLFSDIATKTDCKLLMHGDSLSIEPNSSSTEQAIVMTQVREGDGKVISNSGLIGYPELTNDGIDFQCLINPDLKIGSLVQIDNSIISIEQNGIIPSFTTLGAQLDQDGLYRVLSLSLSFCNDGGDSRISAVAVSRENYGKLEIE